MYTPVQVHEHVPCTCASTCRCMYTYPYPNTRTHMQMGATQLRENMYIETNYSITYVGTLKQARSNRKDNTLESRMSKQSRSNTHMTRETNHGLPPGAPDARPPFRFAEYSVQRQAPCLREVAARAPREGRVNLGTIRGPTLLGALSGSMLGAAGERHEIRKWGPLGSFNTAAPASAPPRSA